jgi:type 1 glutamine amidotransferase
LGKRETIDWLEVKWPLPGGGTQHLRDLTGGDLPVVWTNTKYRMIYMNMGHGGNIYSEATQNDLFENSILWLGNQK